MKVWLKALLLSCSAIISTGIHANTDVVLAGELLQGSLIRGKVLCLTANRVILTTAWTLLHRLVHRY